MMTIEEAWVALTYQIALYGAARDKAKLREIRRGPASLTGPALAVLPRRREAVDDAIRAALTAVLEDTRPNIRARIAALGRE